MKTKKKIRVFARRLFVLGGLFIVAALAHGQTLELLHSFQGPDGWDPHSPLVQGPDGNFYGTTGFGGGSQSNSTFLTTGWGTVFKMTPDGVLTTLVIFNGTNGAIPSGLILGNDGNLYGTAEGGNYGWGMVFRMTPAGMLTTLVSFNGTNGSVPTGGLVQGDDGSFYGVTSTGGNLSLNYGEGYGTFFRLATNGTLSAVAVFNQANGSYPDAGLAKGHDGNFYGTTLLGGAYGNGTMFRVTPNGRLTTLRSFNFNPYATPVGGLTQGSDGNFYGTTTPGADLYGTGGTVFRVSGGQLTTVVSFDDLGYAVGYSSYSPIQASDGNLYGTTGYFFRSEVLQGIVYKIMPDGTWTSLVALDSLGVVARGVSLTVISTALPPAVMKRSTTDMVQGPFSGSCCRPRIFRR